MKKPLLSARSLPLALLALVGPPLLAVSPAAGRSLRLLPAPVRPDVPVSGRVVDEKGQGLPGVTVLVQGTNTGVSTNADGTFALNAPPNSTLIFSSIGFLTQRVALGDQRTVNVTLLADLKTLDDVVVVGYGTRRRSEVSGAVTQIEADKITKQPIASIDQGLAGLVPGVTLREGTGAPGSGPEILIRGINTFGNNKPLIVIDNVILENGNDQNNNPLALLNPEDIETVTILKDAATKAIYGSRATAGVIIITTKRGKEGKPQVTFNTSVGQSRVLEFEKPDVLNATELAQFYKEVNIDNIRATNPAYADPGTPVPDNLIPAQYRNPEQYGKGTNWFDEITRPALIQNHNVAISGGTPVVKYYASLNYFDQEGVVRNNDLKRYSFRTNVDVNVSPKLRFGFNLNPSRTEQNRPADDPGSGGFSAYGTITSTYWADPSVPVYQPNGLFNYTTQGVLTSNFTANPLYQIEAEVEKRRGNQLLLGSYLEFEPLKNLVLRTNFSYGYNQNRSRNFQPATLVGDGLTPVFPNIDGARALLFNSQGNNLISDNTVRYTFEKARHSLTALAGYTVQDQSAENSTLRARRIIDENFQLPDFNNVDRSANGNFTGSEEFGQSRLVSFISRLNYAFADRYLLNLSLRRDGSSRFGRQVQYGNFPAGSVGWRVSEEGFMSGLKERWLDELRLEAGYGITGNNGTSNYGHLGVVGNASYIVGGTTALGNTLVTPPNPTVTWEESKQFDFGLTAAFLKRRINVSANAYQQITSGLLAGLPLSWVTGFGSVTGNQDSRIRNRGYEVQLDVVPVRTDDFTWTSGLNISAYRNKILEYYDPRGFFSGTAGNNTAIAVSAPGQPVGVYRGLQVTGLFTQADIDDPSVPKYPGARVGGLKYADGNGNGKLEIEADYVTLGSPHPDMFFGWNNQLSYKGLSLRTIFAGQFGGLIYDLRREIMWNVDGNFNVDRQVLNRYRPGDDPTTKEFPTTVGAPGATTRYVRFPASNKVYDGTYVALKNVTLDYNFSRLLKADNLRFAKALDLYVSVRNAFYLANYKYGNPEVRRSNDGSALRGINYGSYPISRTITVGLNVTL